MTAYRCEPHPELEGWMSWSLDGPGFFIGQLGDFAVRRESEVAARVRWWPGGSVSNINGTVHGGALLGFADSALFAAATACGIAGAPQGVTIDCSCHFLAPARLGAPVDAIVEIMQETGRLVFFRATMEAVEEKARIATFSAVMRKLRAP